MNQSTVNLCQLLPYESTINTVVGGFRARGSGTFPLSLRNAYLLKQVLRLLVVLRNA